MKTNNQLVDKAYAFVLRIVKLYRYLCEEKNEFVLSKSKQVLRSDTSIDANVEEARETHYWIRLLRDSLYLDSKQVAGLISDCDELLKIAASILVTLKKKHS